MSHETSERPIVIIIAEDDEEDRLLVKEALETSKLANETHFVANGEELLDYLHNRNHYRDKEKYPRPGIILLDLNMPIKDGREALREIKADEDLSHIPVIVLTTSKEEEDIFKTYNLGVTSFLTKPVSFKELVNVILNLNKYWFEIVEYPSEQLTEE
jgi:CheY-like chemotaxis protein